jgi:hypothetical protein
MEILLSHMGGLHLRELAQAGNWVGLAQQMRVAGIYSKSPWNGTCLAITCGLYGVYRKLEILVQKTIIIRIK